MVRGSVLVCGSRSLSVRPDWLAVQVAQVAPAGSWLLLSGGARGVDSVAPRAASLLGWEFAAIRPNYALHGKRRAPLVRNDELVALSSVVLAVWDGRSGGTAYTVRRAHQLGVPVFVVAPPS